MKSKMFQKKLMEYIGDMKLRDTVGLGQVKGSVTYWTVEYNVWTPVVKVQNSILISWGSIAAHLFKGDDTYLPNAMYLEYQNVAAPGDPVTVPSFVRTDNIGYYNNLGANTDFVRVALSSTPALSVYTGYEDYFADTDGNELTFIAQSSGTYGELGRPFTNTDNSKVYGAAIVARPVPADRSKDVILARNYVTGGSQLIKPISGQVAATWSIAFL